MVKPHSFAADELELLTPERAAEILGVSTHTLGRWRRLEKGPAYVRVSAIRVGYPRGHLRRWIELRMEAPRDQSVGGC